MDVHHLPDGELAPAEADCIRVHRVGDGRFRLEGSALDGEESISIGDAFYASAQEAEAAGIAWAAGHNVRLLCVSLLDNEEAEAD